MKQLLSERGDVLVLCSPPPQVPGEGGMLGRARAQRGTGERSCPAHVCRCQGQAPRDRAVQNLQVETGLSPFRTRQRGPGRAVLEGRLC